MERHLRRHTGEQSADVRGHAQGDGVELGLLVGRALHRPDGAVKVWPAALTETSALSPMVSLGTRVSATETVTFIWSAPSITATGMVVEMKLFSTAFMVTRVPDMGAITLPAPSTFSSAVEQLLHAGLGALHPGLQLG